MYLCQKEESGFYQEIEVFVLSSQICFREKLESLWVKNILRLVHARHNGLRFPLWTASMQRWKIPISSETQLSTAESSLVWTSLYSLVLRSTCFNNLHITSFCALTVPPPKVAAPHPTIVGSGVSFVKSGTSLNGYGRQAGRTLRLNRTSWSSWRSEMSFWR